MKILYLGSNSAVTTSSYRAKALQRLGHGVINLDPYAFVGISKKSRFIKSFHYKTGYKYLQRGLRLWLENEFCSLHDIEVVWVDSGELFGKNVLKKIGELKVPIILFNHDDPTGKRDGNRFKNLKEAIPYYTLITAVRHETEDELKILGAKKVIRIWRSYDEVMHNKNLIKGSIEKKFISEICFIGTWMRGENRDEFLLKLIKRGLDVSIWGARWNKSKYWPELRDHWRGDALGGEDYVKAIVGSKICLGFLSKGNRDLHTTRTMEIPYAGGLLCAERTAEHIALYNDREEAFFWEDVDECYEICTFLLDNSELREKVALAGHKRALANNHSNENICSQILTATFE